MSAVTKPPDAAGVGAEDLFVLLTDASRRGSAAATAFCAVRQHPLAAGSIAGLNAAAAAVMRERKGRVYRLLVIVAVIRR